MSPLKTPHKNLQFNFNIFYLKKNTIFGWQRMQGKKHGAYERTHPSILTSIRRRPRCLTAHSSSHKGLPWRVPIHSSGPQAHSSAHPHICQAAKPSVQRTRPSRPSTRQPIHTFLFASSAPAHASATKRQTLPTDYDTQAFSLTDTRPSSLTDTGLPLPP